MTKNKINSLQLCSMVTFIIISTITGIGMTNLIKVANRDSYLSVIISAIMGIIPLVMIIIIGNYDKEANINEIINEVFGKYVGKFINFLLFFWVLIIGIVTMYSICNFIVSQFLSATPILAIAIFVGIVVLYALIKGGEVISRVGTVLLVFTLILYVVSVLSLIYQVDFSNLQPFLEKGVMRPLKGGGILFLTNIVPIFLILGFPRGMAVDEKNYNKMLIVFYIIAIVMAFLTTFITTSVLGLNIASAYQYPEYTILRKISLFGFLDRIENLISMQWYFRCFVMLSIVSHFLKNTVKDKSNSKLLSLVIVVLLILGSVYIFKNNTIFEEFILNVYPYINLGFLGLFGVIMIGCMVKKKKKKLATAG